MFVAEQAGVVTGFAEFATTGYIDCFYVHHAWQGAGLTARIEGEAHKRMLPGLFADVSITARPCFEKMGFRVVREQTKRYRGVGFDQTFMRNGWCNADTDTCSYHKIIELEPICLDDNGLARALVCVDGYVVRALPQVWIQQCWLGESGGTSCGHHRDRAVPKVEIRVIRATRAGRGAYTRKSNSMAIASDTVNTQKKTVCRF